MIVIGLGGVNNCANLTNRHSITPLTLLRNLDRSRSSGRREWRIKSRTIWTETLAQSVPDIFGEMWVAKVKLQWKLEVEVEVWEVGCGMWEVWAVYFPVSAHWFLWKIRSIRMHLEFSTDTFTTLP